MCVWVGRVFCLLNQFTYTDILYHIKQPAHDCTVHVMLFKHISPCLNLCVVVATHSPQWGRRAKPPTLDSAPIPVISTVSYDPFRVTLCSQLLFLPKQTNDEMRNSRLLMNRHAIINIYTAPSKHYSSSSSQLVS